MTFRYSYLKGLVNEKLNVQVDCHKSYWKEMTTYRSTNVFHKFIGYLLPLMSVCWLVGPNFLKSQKSSTSKQGFGVGQNWHGSDGFKKEDWLRLH